MSKIKRILKLTVVTALAVGTFAGSVLAKDPYNAYIYDYWEDPIPSQNGYLVDTTLTGLDIGVGSLNEASDFFLTKNEEFLILDTGNNRIIRTDLEFNLIDVYDTFPGASIETLSGAKGIYVTDDDIVYVADTGNSRILKLDINGNFLKEYTKPDVEAYNSETFGPTKVIVDKAGNIYAIVPSINVGAVMIDDNGSFLGYYGANRVEVTAAMRVQRIWRKLASETQRIAMGNQTPVEYANFDVDEDGFIYTVTEAGNTTTDAVKKLNPAGYNIWDNEVGNTYKFGDLTTFYDGRQTFSTRLTDIAIGDNGIINVLDYGSKRIFQYDREAQLLLVFGSNASDQRGGFLGPSAIETHGEKIYVLDARKNNITVFQQTKFGGYVHEATELYNQGRYEEAIEPWTQVIQSDGNYARAYSGIGRAYLNSGRFKEAMEYFKIPYDQKGYNRAFEGYRQEFLREHFTTIVVGIFVLIIALIVINKLRKKGVFGRLMIKIKGDK